MSNIFSEDSMEIQYNNSVNNEKNVNTSLDIGLSNIKCEFDEEETKIQSGDSENQLLKENVEHKFSSCIPMFQDDERGEFPESFQKNQTTISDKFSQKAVNIIHGEIKSDINEESNAYLDYELSNIKCEFDEEETKIQYGIEDDQLREENITKYSTDITTLQILNGASSQKNDPTIFELGLKRHHEIQTEENWSTQNKHMKSPSGENPFKCETCGQCFRWKDTLISHRTIHKLEKPIKCEIHEKGFSRKNMHMIIHTGEKPHKCEICGKCFNTKSNLTRHIRFHIGVKPHKCEICGKCFIENATLKRHMKIHTGEKPIKNHKCEICGKYFINKKNLDTHKMTHTGDEPYKCETCSKCFIQKQQLNRHMRIHIEEKPHKCEMCGKCFIEKVHLKNHMRIHTGEKPHKCKICGRCFSDKSNLHAHMRIHIGEKSHKCEMCGKCFLHNGKLKRHMRIHTGEKPHKCEICGKCYIENRNLKRHMTIHTGETSFNSTQ